MGWRLAITCYRHTLTLAVLARDNATHQDDASEGSDWHLPNLPNSKRLFNLDTSNLMNAFSMFLDESVRIRTSNLDGAPQLVAVGCSLILVEDLDW